MTLESNKYGIVGRSRAIADVIDRIDLVSATRSTILITGETGTGKELVARAVHSRSTRRNMPFIKVNCAAIPETLLELKLFGHVRGAFTDAAHNKRGKFSLAHGGSIFLDEIGTMSLVLQAKLLRVLQEREIEPGRWSAIQGAEMSFSPRRSSIPRRSRSARLGTPAFPGG
jgi:transcriptional regulator with GAF, ATPase, and Fis domain